MVLQLPFLVFSIANSWLLAKRPHGQKGKLTSTSLNKAKLALLTWWRIISSRIRSNLLDLVKCLKIYICISFLQSQGLPVSTGQTMKMMVYKGKLQISVCVETLKSLLDIRC